jgi:hypothetical protein
MDFGLFQVVLFDFFNLRTLDGTIIHEFWIVPNMGRTSSPKFF